MPSSLTEQDRAILESSSLFAGLTPTELERLIENSPIRHYKSRTLLMEKGDPASALYLVLEGRVRIFVQSDDGKELTLSEMEVGQMFGELALISDSPRSASAVTLTRSRLLVIGKAQFTTFLAESPDAARRMIHHLADKVRLLTQDVERLALRDVYGRLVDVLEARAGLEDGRRVTGPLTQQELANLVGASREMISRIFKELKAGAYISLDGKRIVLERDLPRHW